MAKFKTGDVLKPSACSTGFLHPFLDLQELYTVKGYSGEFVNVSGKFLDGGDGFEWSEDWFESAESEPSAESLRNSILDIRSKREALQKEILQLDEQEKEAVEKLKEQGFVLYEQNVAQTLDGQALVATENKVVLYAEDIEEDMTNPENWKVGDLILCVNGAGWKDWIDEGEVAEMVEELTVGLCLKTKYGVCKFGSSYYEDFRFHSRPVK